MRDIQTSTKDFDKWTEILNKYYSKCKIIPEKEEEREEITIKTGQYRCPHCDEGLNGLVQIVTHVCPNTPEIKN